MLPFFTYVIRLHILKFSKCTYKFICMTKLTIISRTRVSTDTVPAVITTIYFFHS